MSERRSIDVEVIVPGTPEEVWQAIATGPGISAWFVPSRVEEREGGEVHFQLGPDMDSTGRVTAWQPPHRFAYEEEWAPREGREPATIATEFLVEARDQGTCVVRSVSSFTADGYDDDLDGIEAGWAPFLDNLRLYMTHFAGQPSASVLVAGGSTAPKAEAMAALRDALGLGDVQAQARVDVAVNGTPALTGVVERATADELLIRTERPGPGLAGVGVYEWDGATVTTYRAQYFGGDAQTIAAADQRSWEAWMRAHFPAPA